MRWTECWSGSRPNRGGDAALAAREAITAQIEFQLPAQKASAEAAMHLAQVDLDKTLVVAGTAGMVQQFTLRVGDVVNPMLRPAGILVPERRALHSSPALIRSRRTC